KPIQVTDVPVNVIVARAPGTAGVAETAAVPPLQAFVVSPGLQPAVNAAAAAVSSMRVPTTVGGDPGVTSNASTTTALSTASTFFWPVDSTVSVCTPFVRFADVKT